MVEVKEIEWKGAIGRGDRVITFENPEEQRKKQKEAGM